MSMADHNNLVVYHYSFSPYGQKVIWYLTLRGINYAECVQPVYPPRPDLAAIGVKYRRIPVLAHGRDVYVDTRLILAHLDEVFPESGAAGGSSGLAAVKPADRGYARLLEKWAVEGGIFEAAAATLSPDLPALKDPKFVADRQSFSGKSWSRDERLKGIGPGRAVIRDAFDILEEQVLGDGRDWVLGGDRPTRADIDAVWPFHWLSGIPGCLPDDAFSDRHFPRTRAWIARFDAALKAARAKAPKPVTLQGDEAARAVLDGPSLAARPDVDPADPLKLATGQHVETWPTDWGFTHKDAGKVVGLSLHELVIESEAPGGKSLLLHYPRVGFKIEASDAAKL